MLKILVLFLLASLCLTDCPLSNYPLQTTVGYLEAQLDNDPSLHNQQSQFVQVLDKYFSNIPTVAYGISGLQLNPNSQLNFAISHLSQVEQIRFKIRVNDQSYGWRYLKLTYFATTSPLFLIENKEVNQFSVGVQEGHYAIYRPITNFANFNNQPVVRVFISGLDLTAKPLGAEYTRLQNQYEGFKSFSQNQNLIKLFANAVQIQKSLQFSIEEAKIVGRLISINFFTNTQIKSFRYSYVLFSQTTLGEQHNYVFDDFSIVNSGEFKFTGLVNMKMILAGITKLKTTRSQQYYFQLGFQQYLGQSYFKTPMNSHPYLELGFTFAAFEMKKQFVCQTCKDSPIIFQNRFCVTQCPRGFSKSSRDNLIYCDKCDIQKLKVVDSDGQCVCARRHFYSASDDICKTCTYDCMSCQSAARCLTCDTASLQTNRRMNPNGRCQCPAIGFYDDKAAEDIVCQKCESSCRTCDGPRAHDCVTCSADKQLDTFGHCVCKNNFNLIKGQCVCQTPYIVLSNGFCSNPNAVCTQNQVEQFVDLTRRCVCKQGYTQVLDQCIKCEGSSQFDRQTLKCKCTGQTVFIDGKCVPCGVNQQYDAMTGICRCKDGTFKAQDGKCISCPPRMAYINGQCQCIYNYYESSPQVCKRCTRETDGPKCRRTQF